MAKVHLPPHNPSQRCLVSCSWKFAEQDVTAEVELCLFQLPPRRYEFLPGVSAVTVLLLLLLLVAVLIILPFNMSPRYCAEILSTHPEHKKAMMCLSEKICSKYVFFSLTLWSHWL